MISLWVAGKRQAGLLYGYSIISKTEEPVDAIGGGGAIGGGMLPMPLEAFA
ncbi:MAG: hypothetical protein IT173_04340 [Acidobacteria bacterium]|nr:hypothetical protein [Acidobacteriota bacterium]